MVVVASALLVFCVDALVTGQHNRQNAAEQANGAHVLARPSSARSCSDVVGRGRRGRPRTTSTSRTVVTTPTERSPRGPPWRWTRRRSRGWPTSRSPGPESGTGTRSGPRASSPLRLTGDDAGGDGGRRRRIEIRGPLESAYRRACRSALQLPGRRAATTDGRGCSRSSHRSDGSVPLSVDGAVRATGAWSPASAWPRRPGCELSGSLVLRDLTRRRPPFSLGRARGLAAGDDGDRLGGPRRRPRRQPGRHRSPPRVGDPPVDDQRLGARPGARAGDRRPRTPSSPGPGSRAASTMTVGRTLPRVPGSPPGSRVVDLEGLLRRPDAGDRQRRASRSGRTTPQRLARVADAS